MKKLFTFVVSVILLSSIIVPTICVAEEPFVITMLTNYVSFEAPPADHEIFKIIEEETGAKFDVTWIPDSGYNEKVLLTLASGDMLWCLMLAIKPVSLLCSKHSVPAYSGN